MYSRYWASDLTTASFILSDFPIDLAVFRVRSNPRYNHDSHSVRDIAHHPIVVNFHVKNNSIRCQEAGCRIPELDIVRVRPLRIASIRQPRVNPRPSRGVLGNEAIQLVKSMYLHRQPRPYALHALYHTLFPIWEQCVIRLLHRALAKSLIKGMHRRPEATAAHSAADTTEIENQRITTWLDAQHQYAAIALRARQRNVRHVVAAIAATGHTHIRPRPTPRRGTAGAVGVPPAGPAAA